MLYEGLEDSGESGNCIIVPGSKKAPKNRVPKAVSLYRDLRASKMLFCGGIVRETEYGSHSEAMLMKKNALESGIPDEDILLEELSQTTKENILCSLLVLERTFKLCNIGELLVVTTNYHMRRCLLMAETYMPKWIKFYPCPAEDPITQRDNWFKNEKGYQRVMGEAWKIICYVNEKSISDFEI